VWESRWRYHLLTRMLRRISRAVILVACCGVTQCLAAQTSGGQSEPNIGPLPVFELHSGFWVNLHLTLYQQARLRGGMGDSATLSRLPSAAGTLKIAPDVNAPVSAAEQRAWDQAVSYYVANYADQDLVFSTDLTLLRNQLGDFETCDELSGVKKKTCDAGLPGNISHVLESVASVYRAHWWPAHDRANRAWIARVGPLVAEQSPGIARRLADLFQTTWPKEKIRVDLAAYASPAGAYTTLLPLRVTICSTDPRNQGDQALEVLFQEAAHGIAEPLEQAISRESHQREKAIPRDLWPALIFYTTDEVIKPIISSSAEAGHASLLEEARTGLSRRGWSGYTPLISRFWQPYLDGQASFNDAVARIVSSL
jgi:hypothetical protein